MKLKILVGAMALALASGVASAKLPDPPPQTPEQQAKAAEAKAKAAEAAKKSAEQLNAAMDRAVANFQKNKGGTPAATK